jgi:uncharacterized membrane protein YkvA (DUF1232 family)
MNLLGLRTLGTKYFQYLRDPRVPRWRRYAGLFALVYFLLPVDFIPDFIPLLGWLDDLGVLSAAALFIAREVERYQPAPSGWPTPLPEAPWAGPSPRRR